MRALLRQVLGSEVEGAPELLTMGPHSYGAPTVRAFRGDTNRVHIGDYVSMAAGIQIFVGGNHRTDWVSTYPFRVMFQLPGAFEDGHPASNGDVVIGNDVWLGRECTILSGVRIGDGAVVSARALVTKDVRPYAIVGGNPAREIRRRFTDEQVDALLRIAWWTWPEKDVVSRVPELCNGDVDGFIRRYDPKPQG